MPEHKDDYERAAGRPLPHASSNPSNWGVWFNPRIIPWLLVGTAILACLLILPHL